MMTNNKILVVACFLLVHCSGSENCFEARWATLPVQVIATTDNELEVIDTYNSIFDYPIFAASDEGVTITYIDEIVEGENGKMTAGVAYLSCNNGIITSADLVISNAYTDTQTQKIIGHELGHALGIPHLDGFSIMQANNVETDPRTLEELIENEIFFTAVRTRYPEIN